MTGHVPGSVPPIALGQLPALSEDELVRAHGVDLDDLKRTYAYPPTGTPIEIHEELRAVRVELQTVRELLELVMAELGIDPNA